MNVWSTMARVLVRAIVVAVLLGATTGRQPAEASPDGPAASLSPVASGWASEAFARPSWAFEENHGQDDPRVRFRTFSRGVGLFLTAAEAVIIAVERDASGTPGGEVSALHPNVLPRPEGIPQRATVLRMELSGANSKATVAGLDRLPGTVNYFRGRDPSRWRTNVPRYAKVKYEDIYPGVDLLYYYRTDGELEYDFVVAPGADPNRIKLILHGAMVAVDGAGDLLMKTPGGDVRLRRPVVFQDVDGRRQPVQGRYAVDASHREAGIRVGFVVEPYDRSRPLTIDPTLVYSTYLNGTSGPNRFFSAGSGIAVDRFGNTYLAGATNAFDFPTRDPLQSTLSGRVDAFVTKLSPSGGLVWSTYLGGSEGESGTSPYGTQSTAVATDPSGNVYVAGVAGDGFPVTENAVQPHFAGGGTDAFVAKLSAQGSELRYGTYLGGERTDIAEGLAVDSGGSAYVVGTTNSRTFPTKNPIQTGTGGFDSFVTKLNPAGSAMGYSTYLGGSNVEQSPRIAVDSAGGAYVAGMTRSTDFPLRNAFQAQLNQGLNVTSNDVFVTRLNPAGGLVYSTYLGGSGEETIGDIAVDRSGNAYVVGGTTSADFPLKNPLQVRRIHETERSNGFVAKLGAEGATLVYSTHFGTIGPCSVDVGCLELVSGIAVDDAGNAYVTGLTTSTAFPLTAGPIQGSKGGESSSTFDAFVAKLDASGTILPYSTYLGGRGDEVAAFTSPGSSALLYFPRIAVDGFFNAHVTGVTGSVDFPTRSPLPGQGTLHGVASAFVSRMSIPPNDPVALRFIDFPSDVPSLPSEAVVGVPFIGNLGIGGGRPPYGISVVRGALPPGLALGDSSVLRSPTPSAARADGTSCEPGGVGSAIVSGVPRQAGTACFEACATDQDNPQGVIKQFQITTRPAGATGAVPATRRLTINRVGTGNGRIYITIPGDVGPEICQDLECVRDYGTCQSLTLEMEAAAGSTPAGWTDGCSGNVLTCNLTLEEDTRVTATFLSTAGEPRLGVAAAVLPTSRSVVIGSPATANATMLVQGPPGTTAIGCGIGLLSNLPGLTLSYQALTPNGQLAGAPNTPVNIPADGFQNFVFALTASVPMEPRQVELRFSCANAGPAGVIPGVNTLLFSASTTGVPDLVAVVTSTSLRLNGLNQTGAVGVGTTNVGVGGMITVSVDTNGANLPLSLSLCEQLSSGGCASSPASSVTRRIEALAQPPFAVFVTASAPVAQDPGRHRVFVWFKDADNIVRGATSFDVSTP